MYTSIQPDTPFDNVIWYSTGIESHMLLSILKFDWQINIQALRREFWTRPHHLTWLNLNSWHFIVTFEQMNIWRYYRAMFYSLTHNSEIYPIMHDSSSEVPPSITTGFWSGCLTQLLTSCQTIYINFPYFVWHQAGILTKYSGQQPRILHVLAHQTPPPLERHSSWYVFHCQEHCKFGEQCGYICHECHSVCRWYPEGWLVWDICSLWE